MPSMTTLSGVLPFTSCAVKVLPAVGIFAQIELDDLVDVFAGASFDKILGFAVGATFCSATCPNAGIAGRLFGVSLCPRWGLALNGNCNIGSGSGNFGNGTQQFSPEAHNFI